MKAFKIEDINSPSYWDTHQTAVDFGLRQEKYAQLAGKGKRIVELGCGLSPFLSQVNFKEKWGIDYSPLTIQKAREMYPDIHYNIGDITNTICADNHFDVVVCGEVIEHIIDEPFRLLDEMERICKKGGIMILSTPHLEFQDPEHLWEFDEEDFKIRGWETEEVFSERFPGRSYIFAWKRKK